MKSNQIKQKRAALYDEAKALHASAIAGQRDFTPAEQVRFDAIMDDTTGIISFLDQQIKEAEHEEHMQADLRARKHNDGSTDPGFTLPVNGGLHGGQPQVRSTRLRAFKSERDAFDASLFLRASVMQDGAARTQLESRRPAWLASMTEASPTAGGYGVPPEFHNAVTEYREQVGAARQLLTVLPMGSDNLAVPKLSSGPTVYIAGEETAITASDMAFARVNLEPQKRACLSYVSSELRDDNAVGLMDLLASRMGHALVLQEDSEFVAGDGTSTYGGILGVRPALIAATAGIATAATGNDTWAEITYGDLASCMAKLASKYRVRGELAWLCSTPFRWQVFDRLSLAQGGAMASDMVNGIPQATFAGYPIVESDYMPTTTAAATVCCLFGNFRQSCFMGERQGIRVALSEHIGFATDQIAVRGTVRYDIANHEMGNTSTAGGVVALKTAS